jgi:acetylornithine/succinyldiaminopimelate/putrescine aminotransferase
MEITARPPTVFVKGQAETLINASPAFYNQPMLDLAAALTAAAGLERLFFANSGAEANEGAIKLARRHHGRGRHFRGSDGCPGGGYSDCGSFS